MGRRTLFRPAEDRFSSHAPFHFDLSIFDLYVAIKHGASVHLISEELTSTIRDVLAQFIADPTASPSWYSTPSALTLLGEHGRLDQAGVPRTARGALFAGEVFPVKHLRRRDHAVATRRAGTTSTARPRPTSVPLPAFRYRFPKIARSRIRSVCHAAIVMALLVGDDGADALPKKRVCSSSRATSVFDGYWNRPDDNARVFRMEDGKRYYNTGDVVRRDAGSTFIFLGRRDRMVKRRGYRVELARDRTRAVSTPEVPGGGKWIPRWRNETGVRIIACYAGDQPAPSVIELKQFASRELLPGLHHPDEFRNFRRACPVLPPARWTTSS